MQAFSLVPLAVVSGITKSEFSRALKSARNERSLLTSPIASESRPAIVDALADLLLATERQPTVRGVERLRAWWEGFSLQSAGRELAGLARGKHWVLLDLVDD